MWQYVIAPYLGVNKSVKNITIDDVFNFYRDPSDDSYYQPVPPSASKPRQTCNTAINGASYPTNNNSSVVRWTNASGRRVADIRFPDQLYLIGPGASSWFTTEWGTGARLNGTMFKSDGPDKFLRYNHGQGSYFLMVDGHMEYKEASWLMKEAVNASTGTLGNSSLNAAMRK